MCVITLRRITAHGPPPDPQNDILWIDLETYSECDLDRGNYHYAKHPSTEWLFMAWAFNDEPVQLWQHGEPFPQRVNDHILAGGEVWAHNAIFERLLIWYCGARLYGVAKPKIEQMVCTLLQAANMALPLSLENAAIALCLEERKDMDKRKSMLLISKPLKYVNGKAVRATPETHPEDFRKCGEYCVGDVEVERAIAKRVKRLSAFESLVYIMDQEINDKGVKVDIPLVHTMKRLAAKETERLNTELEPLCGLRHTQTVKLADWVRGHGIEVPGLDKYSLDRLLSRPDLPENVRRVLLIRQEAAKSSVAKLQAMLDRCEDDGRARGLFQMGGAVSTLRWAHRAIQTGNMPRPELPPEIIEEILEWLTHVAPEDDELTLETIRMLWGRPMSVFSDCLRGLLIADEGKVLIAPDLVSIESLCAAWLVGDDAKAAFMGAGGDVYKEVARLILGLAPFRGWALDEGVPVTKQQRQMYGKVPELAFGYQGGYKEDGAVGNFCIQNRVAYPGEDEAKRWQTVWREYHPFHVAYWDAITDKAVEAVLNPGSIQALGPTNRRVKFKLTGDFLLCHLPSGSVLCYPFPRVEQPKRHFKPSVTYMKSKDRQWYRNSYFGGHGLENVTQRIARDLLAFGMLSLRANGFLPVNHSHDEAVVETEHHNAEERVCAIFSQRPGWAATLPYRASAFTAKRYRK